MKININGITRDMTPAEEADFLASIVAAEVEEAHRTLTGDEVLKIITQKIVNTVEIDDATSLRMADYYPEFTALIGQTVKEGYKFRFGGELWKTRQQTTIQAHYQPGAGTESLFVRIDEAHTGTADDPIPFALNMELTAGLYYVQDGVIYRCTRDLAAAYWNLAELVGQYVEAANGGD